MTWAKLSDNFHSHPKVLEMGNAAAGLYARGLSFAACYLTDGELPTTWVARQDQRLVKKLLETGVWSNQGNGHIRITDFLDYNPSREEVSQKRADARERVTRYRKRKSNALPTRPIGPDPTRPVVKDQDGLALDVGNELVSNVLGDVDVTKEISDYARELRDANEATEAVLTDLRRRLPEAAFHSAMEALRERRERQPALVSETRYFVASLRQMIRDGRYDA